MYKNKHDLLYIFCEFFITKIGFIKNISILIYKYQSNNGINLRGSVLRADQWNNFLLFKIKKNLRNIKINWT